MEKIVFLAYLITIISEVFVILLIQKPKNVWRWIMVILLINSFTHPLVMYFLHIVNTPYILVETTVFTVETIFLKFLLEVNFKRAIILSLIANISSILVGLIIRSISGL